MTPPAVKRFDKKFTPVADAIARLDIDQEVREQVARAVTEGFEQAGDRDFKADLFELLASDPLVPCAGALGAPCPHGRELRIAMHYSEGPDGRSAAWARRPGETRCVSCGAAEFVPGYAENVAEYKELVS